MTKTDRKNVNEALDEAIKILRGLPAKSKRRSPSKRRALEFPTFLKVTALVLAFATLMFGLGYKAGFDTATIERPPCPSGKMIPWPPVPGLGRL